MKTWVKALMASALVLGPASAFAAIDNTHHDMPFITGGSTIEKCTYCHSKTGLGAGPGLGRVGDFCVVVCHTGVGDAYSARNQVRPTSPGVYTTFTPAVTAQDASAPGAVGQYGRGTFAYETTGYNTPDIFANGHQMSKAVLNGTISATEATSVTNIGWPYTQGDNLQCTSCHSVHDASNPPFLNAKLSDGTQTGGFCQRCHTDIGRRSDITGTGGSHPVEMQWSELSASTRTGNSRGGRDLLNIVAGSAIDAITGPIINVAAGSAVAPATAGSLNSANANAYWNLGGHVVNTTSGLPNAVTAFTNGAAGNNQFGCYSCHTVHVASTASNSYANLLLVGGSLSTVCYGCHTLEPGRTGYGHPIDSEVPLIDSRATPWDLATIIVAETPYESMNPYYLNGGTYSTSAHPAPLCVGCHAVHSRGTGEDLNWANRFAIRNVQAATATLNSACEMCHTKSFNNPTTSANQHHPGANVGTNYAAFAATSWTTLDGNGSLADGLGCADCHVGDGVPTTKRSSAHNWR